MKKHRIARHFGYESYDVHEGDPRDKALPDALREGLKLFSLSALSVVAARNKILPRASTGIAIAAGVAGAVDVAIGMKDLDQPTWAYSRSLAQRLAGTSPQDRVSWNDAFEFVFEPEAYAAARGLSEVLQAAPAASQAQPTGAREWLQSIGQTVLPSGS